MIKALSGCVALALFAGCLAHTQSEEPQDAAPLQEQLAGDWFVAKQVAFDSKSEEEPSIHKLTFATNGVVKWYTSIDGRLVGNTGKYEVRQVEKQKHPNVAVMAQQEKMAYPIVLVMKNVEIDFDSRFHMTLVGKVLRFQHNNGKNYVLTRKSQEQQ